MDPFTTIPENQREIKSIDAIGPAVKNFFIIPRKIKFELRDLRCGQVLIKYAAEIIFCLLRNIVLHLLPRDHLVIKFFVQPPHDVAE